MIADQRQAGGRIDGRRQRCLIRLELVDEIPCSGQQEPVFQDLNFRRRTCSRVLGGEFDSYAAGAAAFEEMTFATSFVTLRKMGGFDLGRRPAGCMASARGRGKLELMAAEPSDKRHPPRERTALDGKIPTKSVDPSVEAVDPGFADFVRRIRAGDDQAAQELVNRFESLIRREVRLRISGSQVNRAFDSLDVTQSVLANFFVRAAAGQFELEHADQLARLLVTMARNKLVSRVRSELRQIRDIRRVTVEPNVLDRVADQRPSPSEIVARKELLERLRTLLSDEERQIIDLRNQGLGWEEVATRLGGSGQARRMQMSRGIERLTRQLGITEQI